MTNDFFIANWLNEIPLYLYKILFVGSGSGGFSITRGSAGPEAFVEGHPPGNNSRNLQGLDCGSVWEAVEGRLNKEVVVLDAIALVADAAKEPSLWAGCRGRWVAPAGTICRHPGGGSAPRAFFSRSSLAKLCKHPQKLADPGVSILLS
jgi:hypothetical protein